MDPRDPELEAAPSGPGPGSVGANLCSSVQSKDAGIRTLVMLDEQGGSEEERLLKVLEKWMSGSGWWLATVSLRLQG